MVSVEKRPILFPSYIVPGTIDDTFEFPPPISQNRELNEWAERQGAIDANYTDVMVTVTGQSSTPVILTNLAIQVIHRRPPVAGTRIGYLGGDITPVRWMSFDLDKTPPTLTESVDARFEFGMGEGKETPVTFPYEVSATEAEVFFITVNTRRCDCSWIAELSWTAGSDQGSTIIDLDGSPFRTSSARNVISTYASIDGVTFERQG